MSARIRIWFKDNFLLLIVAAMFAAFFVNYEADRKFTEEFRDEMRNKWDDHETKITVLYFALIADPNLTPTQKEILMEYAPKRGVKIKK